MVIRRKQKSWLRNILTQLKLNNIYCLFFNAILAFFLVPSFKFLTNSSNSFKNFSSSFILPFSSKCFSTILTIALPTIAPSAISVIDHAKINEDLALAKETLSVLNIDKDLTDGHPVKKKKFREILQDCFRRPEKHTASQVCGKNRETGADEYRGRGDA